MTIWSFLNTIYSITFFKMKSSTEKYCFGLKSATERRGLLTVRRENVSRSFFRNLRIPSEREFVRFQEHSRGVASSVGRRSSRTREICLNNVVSVTSEEHAFVPAIVSSCFEFTGPSPRHRFTRRVLSVYRNCGFQLLFHRQPEETEYNTTHNDGRPFGTSISFQYVYCFVVFCGEKNTI